MAGPDSHRVDTELVVEHRDERGPVPTQEAVEVGGRHARREALAHDAGDAVDEDFGRGLHGGSEEVLLESP